jgi:hypothetical protein
MEIEKKIETAKKHSEDVERKTKGNGRGIVPRDHYKSNQERQTKRKRFVRCIEVAGNE